MKRKQRQERVKQAMLAMQRFPWEQGVASQALLELGDEELTYLFARDAVLRQSNDGRLGAAFYRDDIALFGDELTVADPASNGEAVLFVAGRTGERWFEDAAQKQLRWLIDLAPKSETGVICHVANKRQVWVDSIFMALPFLVLAGKPREAFAQVVGFRSILWDSNKNLFSHIWDDEKKSFACRDFWGVGNGWAASGMAKMVRSLPADMNAEKTQLCQFVSELLDSCLKYQTKEGLFHNIIDDPSTFTETNLAQMLCYTIYSGVNEGWLEKKYIDYAEVARETIYTKVDDHGLVQGVCGSPTFAVPGTAVEGQAFFLLMEAAIDRYSRLL
jgi:unsaturated rhamnogalacturonyl hydrolase